MIGTMSIIKIGKIFKNEDTIQYFTTEYFLVVIWEFHTMYPNHT